MDTVDKNTLLNIDEYGRINIEDKDLLELITGAVDFLPIVLERCNNGCGSNRTCANINCK